VAHGLEYLNSCGFMHRDIKPPNLLLNRNGQVKITDFGIGRRLADAHSGLGGGVSESSLGGTNGVGCGDSDSNDGEDMASTFVGTRNYMSLERLKGDKYRASADGTRCNGHGKNKLSKVIPVWSAWRPF
jgi:serine/threonine protein kinase